MAISGKKRSNSVKVKVNNFDYLSNIKKGASEAPVTSKEKEKINLKQIKSTYENFSTQYETFKKNMEEIKKKETNSRSKKSDLNNLIIVINRNCKNLGSSFPEFFESSNKKDLVKSIDLRLFTDKVQNLCLSFNVLVDDYAERARTLNNNYQTICDDSKKHKILPKDLKEYRRKKDGFMKECKEFISDLTDVNGRLKENIENFDQEIANVSEKIQSACEEATKFLRSKKTDKSKLEKYKMNFTEWYTKKATENDLKKYRGNLSDTFLWKKSPRVLIDKINKCKTMEDFEALIAKWGMKRNDLKNKKIFGNAVK